MNLYNYITDFVKKLESFKKLDKKRLFYLNHKKILEQMVLTDSVVAVNSIDFVYNLTSQPFSITKDEISSLDISYYFLIEDKKTIVNNNSDIVSLFVLHIALWNILRIYNEENLKEENKKQLENDLDFIMMISFFIESLIENNFIEKVLHKKGNLLKVMKEQFNLEYYVQESLLNGDIKSCRFNFSNIVNKKSFNFKETKDLYFCNNLVNYLLKVQNIDSQHIEIIKYIDKFSSFNISPICVNYKKFGMALYSTINEMRSRLTVIEDVLQINNKQELIKALCDNVTNTYKASTEKHGVVFPDFLDPDKSYFLNQLDKKDKGVKTVLSKMLFLTSIITMLPLFLTLAHYYRVKDKKQKQEIDNNTYQILNEKFSFLSNENYLFLKLHKYYQYFSEERKKSLVNQIKSLSNAPFLKEHAPFDMNLTIVAQVEKDFLKNDLESINCDKLKVSDKRKINKL